MKRVALTSAALETAAIIREEILSYEGDQDEWLLGSETDVQEMLGVSRPTLRQAARILEQEQLLVVRRGVGGGLLGTRPSGEGVRSVASVFLRAQSTTIGQLLQTAAIIIPECAKLAAENPSPAARAQVRDFYSRRVPDPSTDEFEAVFFASQDFCRALSICAENPALIMFVDVLMGLAASAQGVIQAYRPESRRRMTQEHHQVVANLVWEGNGEAALTRMRQHLEELLAWMPRSTLSRKLDPLPVGRQVRRPQAV